jgi:tetratricopeptide (TPR) repeat protein
MGKILPLAGREVAFTGRLVSMTRGDAIDRIGETGGSYVRVPGESTHLLVAGHAHGPLKRDGGVPDNLVRFKELRERGAPVRLLQEPEFLHLIGAEEEREDFTRLYTADQVSRIVDAPLPEIRAWIRHGLLQPARVTGRLAWFRFEEIVGARTLSRLASAGVPAARIRRSLDEISRWLPDAGRMLSRLDAYERGMRVRLSGGEWAEPSGQLLMDLGGEAGAGSARVAAFPRVEWARSSFLTGVEAEERGDLDGAVRAYTRALEERLEAETCFNLGNVLYSQGRDAEAAGRYIQAVELDPDFVEAWNNLGNAMAALGKDGQAIRSYEIALSVEPGYPEAHCNLASVLERAGRRAEACTHRISCEKAYPRERFLTLLKGRQEDDGEG